MNKYEIKEMKFSELKAKIVIPKFQRGLVWNKGKKGEFIKTLKGGLPIGVLLLYPKDDKFLVIDGLQRFTTMREYSRNYFNYIDAEEITDLDISNIIYSAPKAMAIQESYSIEKKAELKEDLRRIIINSITNANGKKDIDIANDVTTKIFSALPIFSHDNAMNLLTTVFKIIDSFSKNANIDDIVIPIILFKGNENELASIFQKLNQEGVKLTKYDVFAATWIGHTVTIHDDSFIDVIIKKYESAEESSDLEISGFDEDEMKQSGQLTVFEYAFGIGKELGNNCKKLIPNVTDAKVDSIGFVLLAELLGLSYGKMGDLAQRIEELPDLDYKDLKNKIIQTAAEIERCLGNYIIAPTASRTSLACHAELQLVSYIVVLFKLKYKIETDKIVSRPKTETKTEITNFKKYLFKHYLNDIIRGNWAGSGDSKLAEITKNPERSPYILDVDKGGFEHAITDWLLRSNAKTNSKQVSKQNKLILNYILRSRITVGNAKFDVEHCVPQKVLEKYYLEEGIVVPVSAICNTIYIPYTDNRSKKDNTYYQNRDESPSAYKLDDTELANYLYPSRDELRFVESQETLTEENYTLFLENRVPVMKGAMIKALFPDD